jgi:hypothetical protein
MRGLIMNQMQRAMRKRKGDRDMIPYHSKENTIILVLYSPSARCIVRTIQVLLSAEVPVLIVERESCDES